MRYTSKYIEEILTSPSARRGLDYITPIYQNAYVALWLMQAIGLETDDFLQWAEEFQDQIIPQTATWSLPYWEDEYGIPTNENLPIEERQRAVLLAVRTRAPMNPKKLAHILSLSVSLAKVDIQENIAKNTFSVVVEEAVNKQKLKKMYEILDKVKPAHLIYWVNILNQIAVKNKNSVCVHKLRFSLSHQNLNIKTIYLNRERQLDGSWQLQTMASCIHLNRLKIGLSNKNVISCSQAITFSVAVKSTFSVHTSLEVIENSLVKNSMKQSIAFYQNSSLKETETTMSYLIMNTMWRIAGEVMLNGERKLNAQIIKITL